MDQLYAVYDLWRCYPSYRDLEYDLIKWLCRLHNPSPVHAQFIAHHIVPKLTWSTARLHRRSWRLVWVYEHALSSVTLDVLTVRAQTMWNLSRPPLCSAMIDAWYMCLGFFGAVADRVDMTRHLTRSACNYGLQCLYWTSQPQSVIYNGYLWARRCVVAWPDADYWEPLWRQPQWSGRPHVLQDHRVLGVLVDLVVACVPSSGPAAVWWIRHSVRHQWGPSYPQHTLRLWRHLWPLLRADQSNRLGRQLHVPRQCLEWLDCFAEDDKVVRDVDLLLSHLPAPTNPLVWREAQDAATLR